MPYLNLWMMLAKIKYLELLIAQSLLKFLSKMLKYYSRRHSKSMVNKIEFYY